MYNIQRSSPHRWKLPTRAIFTSNVEGDHSRTVMRKFTHQKRQVKSLKIFGLPILKVASYYYFLFNRLMRYISLFITQFWDSLLRLSTYLTLASTYTHSKKLRAALDQLFRTLNDAFIVMANILNSKDLVEN